MTSLSTGALLGFSIAGIALLGSLIGTLSVILSAKGTRERTYVAIGYSLLWLVAFAFLALCFLLPTPWTYVTQVIFFLVIPVGAFRITMKSQIIRAAESQKKP